MFFILDSQGLLSREGSFLFYGRRYVVKDGDLIT
jgi:hypothetical protein